VFLIVSWLLFSKPFEKCKGIHPPLISIKFVFKRDKLLNKVVGRSKRDYTLLDLPCYVLHALGSKRAYTPREVANPISTQETPQPN
jgi:hypothetical protein